MKILLLHLTSLASYHSINLLSFSAKLGEKHCLYLLSPTPLLSPSVKQVRGCPKQSTFTICHKVTNDL